MTYSRRDALLLLVLTGLCTFLTLNFHSRTEIGNYKSELYSDKAGYYIYLPATFHYGWRGEAIPDSILSQSGKGFLVEGNRIFTKYPYGVALLELPFFLVGQAVAALRGQPQDGFQMVHHKMIDLAAVAYLVLGMVLLFHFLRRYGSRLTVYLTLFLLLCGTHLYHYALKETGMSHVFSFFAFSATLLAYARYQESPGWQRALALGLAAGLVLVLRPVNVLLFPGLLVLVPQQSSSGHPWQLRHMGILAVAVLVMAIPQMIYWYHLSGNPLHYAYGNETFSHLLDPPLHKLWFSTHNSLFVWTPLWVLILAGIWLGRACTPFRWKWMAYFLFLSYILASWHSWGYGCAMGSRPFVEYLSLFSIPLSCTVAAAWQRRKHWQGMLLLAACAAAITVNLRLTYAYDGCWYWEEWDWNAYWNLLR